MERYMTTTVHFLDEKLEANLTLDTLSLTGDDADKVGTRPTTWQRNSNEHAKNGKWWTKLLGLRMTMPGMLRLSGSPLTCLTWDVRHTLQLCVNSGLGGSRIVANFKRSTVATSAIIAKQEEFGLKQDHFGLKQHKLLQSSATRWNSVHISMERSLEESWSVCSVLSHRRYTSISWNSVAYILLS